MSAPARVDALRMASGGPVVETSHRVHVAVVDADGTVLASAGDVERMTPLRSCAKPFQALAMFTSGAVDKFGIFDAELALACASHDGGLRHLAFVNGWLERLGLDVTALQCGAHAPADGETLAALALAHEAPSPLHNNCSGKHTGMLATALALGATTRDYLRLAHPVQREIVQILSYLTGEGELRFAVDGCSAPTAILSLSRLAWLGAHLAAPVRIGDATLAAGLARLVAAMQLHADLVGGNGVIDSLIMRSLAGVVAKRGADGVYLLGVANADAPFARGPVGVALKVEDGSGDARDAAVLAVLEALGVLVPAARTSLARYLRAPRKNHRDLVVGHWAVDLSLEPRRS